MRDPIRNPWLAALLGPALLLAACGQADVQVEAPPPTVPSPAPPPAPLAWRDVGIGIPAASGGHAWDGKVLTVTGAGAGLDRKGGDQVHFACVTRAEGDFEIVARLAAFTGVGDAMAGLMVRSGPAPDGAMAAAVFTAKDNAFGWRSRVPGAAAGAKPKNLRGGIPLTQPPPLWIRMVRIGGDFAVYKSRDGQLWSMASNVSGGPCAVAGPLDIGCFASAGSEGAPAVATFDGIAIGEPRMRYRTSWVGNSFGCRSADNHVSNGLSAMWVAPDGTCYTSSYWDEGCQPVTSYRDGRVARPLPVGTPQTAEGGITGDGRRIYVASVDRITVLDPAAPDFAPRPLHLSVSLFDAAAKRCAVSGLASNGRELFVADARADLIRVATLDPVPAYHVAGAANDGIANAPAPVAVPADDPRFAPALVYQSQRVGEGNRYTIPGLVAGGRYTLRCHFAEYIERQADCDPRNRVIAIGKVEVNVAELAGGVRKPLVRDFPDQTANSKGEVVFHHGAYGGPGLCGFEILDPQGKRVFAMNCGGPPVGEFRGESPDLVARSFAVERPGPMAVDVRGDLWIIQRGNDFPIGGRLTAAYPAAVRCYKPDGTFTGRAITDVVNPRALGYDAAKDQLLVAENGTDLNVRFYGGLAAQPVLARTFGEPGGIYAGKHPGLVHDPAAGGAARFAGLSGVGVDARGNLYVGGGFQGSDLRMFTPEGKLGWMLNSLMFCNTYDVDPDSDGREIYGTYNHLSLDLAKTAPGSEQRYVGYNWDLRRFGEPVRAGNSQAIVRRLGPERRLIMFTSGQGQIGDINIYRYEGEIAIPAGGTRDQGKLLWIDADGDGRESPAERQPMTSPIGGVTALCIDATGDLWAANSTTAGSFMRRFAFRGCNPHGVPVYGHTAGDGYEDIRFPEEGDKTSAWSMASRMDYDAGRDVLIAFYPAVRRTGEDDRSPSQYFLARYDRWRAGNRTPTWKFKAFTPQTDPAYFMYETNPYRYGGYMGMQIAGDYLFLAYIHGEVQVFDLATGKLVEILAMGPEVAGNSAWEDAAMGLRAFRRADGEYLIFTENSGWGGKNHLFRWRPAADR